MSYADHKYGIIERHWFGLLKKVGGNAATGFTQNETESTQVTRFYPKGPIRLLKFGAMVQKLNGKAEVFHVLLKNGTRIDRCVSSTNGAAYTINSVVLDDDIDPGSYLTITSSTSTCSTGTYAFFVDFRRIASSKWHPTS
jgi:hypothetical protein